MKQTAFVLILLYTFHKLLAETKVLSQLSLYQPGHSLRDEVISVKNIDTEDEELVIEGKTVIEYSNNNKTGLTVKSETEFTADKRGYLIRYKFFSLPTVENRLSAAALKTSAG